jgi:hypothetical protein
MEVLMRPARTIPRPGSERYIAAGFAAVLLDARLTVALSP